MIDSFEILGLGPMKIKQTLVGFSGEKGSMLILFSSKPGMRQLKP